MNPIELSKTIYLGDRYAKDIDFNEKEKVLKIKIDIISRIRGDNGWNYYNDENITDGCIVFTGVEEYSFSKKDITINGNIVFDEIRIKSVEYSKDTNFFTFNIWFYCYKDNHHNGEEVILKIIASGMYLEDPSKPELRIIE